jgi:hypothetical protein
MCVAAMIVPWGFISIVQVYRQVTRAVPPWWTYFVAATLFPMQGILNGLIYFYSPLNNKRNNPDHRQRGDNSATNLNIVQEGRGGGGEDEEGAEDSRWFSLLPMRRRVGRFLGVLMTSMDVSVVDHPPWEQSMIDIIDEAVVAAEV